MIYPVIMKFIPFILLLGFIIAILFMLVRSYQDVSAGARQERKRARQNDVDACIGNKNSGTPGFDIVEVLRDVKINYKGVINVDEQRI